MSNCALHWTGRCFATLVLTSPREGQTVLLRCSSSARVADDANDANDANDADAIALGERCVAQLHALGADGYLADAAGG